MANRSNNRRRKKSKKRGALGLLGLELVGIVAFAALLTTAQSQRDAAVDASHAPNLATQPVGFAVDNKIDWQPHEPQFTQVIGELWEAGF